MRMYNPNTEYDLSGTLLIADEFPHIYKDEQARLEFCLSLNPSSADSRDKQIAAMHSYQHMKCYCTIVEFRGEIERILFDYFKLYGTKYMKQHLTYVNVEYFGTMEQGTPALRIEFMDNTRGVMAPEFEQDQLANVRNDVAMLLDAWLRTRGVPLSPGRFGGEGVCTELPYRDSDGHWYFEL